MLRQFLNMVEIAGCVWQQALPDIYQFEVGMCSSRSCDVERRVSNEPLKPTSGVAHFVADWGADIMVFEHVECWASITDDVPPSKQH